MCTIFTIALQFVAWLVLGDSEFVAKAFGGFDRRRTATIRVRVRVMVRVRCRWYDRCRASHK